MKNIATALMTEAAGSDFLDSIGGRFRNGHGDDSEEYPYCVFLLPVSNDPQILSTFDRDYEDILMQFSIYSSLYAPSEAWTIYGYLTTLFDDCTLSITGRTLIRMWRRNTVLMGEDHTVAGGLQRVHHIAVDYELVTRVG